MKYTPEELMVLQEEYAKDCINGGTDTLEEFTEWYTQTISYNGKVLNKYLNKLCNEIMAKLKSVLLRKITWKWKHR